MSKRSGPVVIAVLATLLLVLHQDYWFWTNRTLVFGIFPIGLFWHICISIAAVLTWTLATRIAWPFDDADSRTTRESQQSAANHELLDTSGGEGQH